MVDVLFTVDYEIHGNGQGLFRDFCYLPMERMLDMANKYGAKVTLMVEMEHIFAMQKHESVFKEDLALLKQQLKRAILEGHDVQLHLHPQWRNAVYVNGKWSFPYSIKEVSYLCDDYEYALNSIQRAKKWLEDYLKPLKPGYQCVAFRAGYFQIQPSSNVLRALLNNGIVCDTSVSRGLKVNDKYHKLDFHDVRTGNKPYRADIDNIVRENKSSLILELPLFTHLELRSLRILKNLLKSYEFKLSRTISRVQTNMIQPDSKIGANIGRNNSFMKALVSNLLRSQFPWAQVDFCKHSPRRIHKIIVSTFSKHPSEDVPLVLMGHSKDFVYSNNLDNLLRSLSSNTGTSYIGLQEAVKKYY